MTAKLNLYHYYRSSCSWRVRWALIYKGVPFEAHSVNLLADEQNSTAYRTKNPNGQVPSLCVGGDTFAESLAILEWLEESYRQRPLLPSDPLSRLRVRQLAAIVAVGVQPLQNLAPMRYAAREREAQLAYARHWIAKGLQAYETLLAQEQLAGTYSFGAQLTIADLCLIPQCYNARRFAMNLQDYPLIAGIYGRCLSTEACQASAPENYGE